MEDIDTSAKGYLHTLLSDENQQRIAAKLREYKGAEKERIKDFKAILDDKIAEKEKKYNTLMKNLASGVLPEEVVADIGLEMKSIKDEIEALKKTEPPKDYTVDQIRAWLTSLKECTDEAAIHLLIERIDIKNKTEINIQSTLNSVLCETGCGGRI